MCKLCGDIGWIVKWRYERMYGKTNSYAVRCPNGCSASRYVRRSEPTAPLFEPEQQEQQVIH